MPTCWAVGCSNVAGRAGNKTASGQPIPENEKLSFHHFPLKKPELLRRWLHNIGREGSLPNEKSSLCSVHFLDDCFAPDLFGKLMLTPRRRARRKRWLKDDAVPTEFAQRKTAAVRPSSAGRKRQSRQLLTELLSSAETTPVEASSIQPKKRKVAETAKPMVPEPEPEPESEPEPSFLLVDVIESSAVAGFSGYTDLPKQVTPVKYTCMYGTPKRTSRDHSYASANVRTIGIQTDLRDVTVQLITPTAKKNPSAEDVSESSFESPITESDIEMKSPGKLSDYIPSDASSSSSSSTSGDDDHNPIEPCEMRKFLVFQSCLDELHKFCKDCGSSVTEKSYSTSGSMVKYKINCHRGHSYTWLSQPMIRKQPVGNLLISAAILTSGTTFGKMAAFADGLKLQFFSKSVFNRIQRANILPVIQDTWEKERTKAVKHLKQLKGDLILAGDARCDSPGHTAKYGSYTLMHGDGQKSGSKKIVSMKLVQVSEVKNSNGMEPEGLIRCLDEVRKDNLKVKVLATDRHKTVESIMSKSYKKIDHQFDTWHVAKGIVKKLSMEAKKKECSELGPWIQSISNHLWWCCANCDGNEQLLREKWLSVLQHVTNRHKWCGNSHVHKCGHPPLSAEDKKSTKWLKPKSKAFKALQAVVTNTSLLKALRKLTKFCHTGELEIFHSMLLKFCPKRQHFQYDVMSARLMLAAIDWNNMQMEQRKDKTGKPATSIIYSKRRKLWVVRNRYTRVQTNHMFDLMKNIYRVHKDNVTLKKFVVPTDLPKHVGKTPKPEKSELAQKFRSRFK